MPNQIEMSRADFCRRFGFWPDPRTDAYSFYTPDGVVTAVINLIPDAETGQAEVEWLERLYSL